MNSHEYIQQLEDKISQLTAERDASFKRNQELEKEIEALKKRLRLYENPHTPPSARKIQKADKTSPENNPVPKKRGAPNGHKGATRPAKEPDEIVNVIADHCEKCGGSNIEKQDKCETSIIEDLPPPQKIKTTQYYLWKVKCKDCEHASIYHNPVY